MIKFDNSEMEGHVLILEDGKTEVAIFPPGLYGETSDGIMVYTNEAGSPFFNTVHKMDKCTIGKVVHQERNPGAGVYILTLEPIERPDPKPGKFIIMSPDGFRIGMDDETSTAETRLDAMFKIGDFINGFVHQGYYSHTKYGRISLSAALEDTLLNCYVDE